MKPIPVIFVCWNRAYYIEQTLLAYLSRIKYRYGKFPKLMKLFVYSQGSDDETLDVIRRNKRHLPRVKIVPVNEGHGTGITKAFEWVKSKIDFDYFILLEDDWLLAEPLNAYIKEMVVLLDKRPDIGCIRLRNIAEQVSMKNRLSGELVKQSLDSKNIMVGNYHYTTNPHIMRKEVMEKLIPFEHSKIAMNRYHDLGLLVGQLQAYCFTHIGIRRSEGWRSGMNYPPSVGDTKRGIPHYGLYRGSR